MYYKDYPLTLGVWESEYKRIENRYKKIDNKFSDEARGYIDQMQAVRSIMKDVQDNAIIPRLTVVE